MKLRLLTIPVLIMIMTGGFFNDFAEQHFFPCPPPVPWEPGTSVPLEGCKLVSIASQAKIQGYWMEEEEEGRGKGLRLPSAPYLYAGYECEVWVFIPLEHQGETWRWNFLAGYDHFWVEKNGQEIYRKDEDGSVNNPQEDQHYSSNIFYYWTNSPDRNAEYLIHGES